MNPPPELKKTILKWIATPFTASEKITRQIYAATLATVDFILCNLGIYFEDLKRLKDAALKRIEAEADEKVAQAAEAANRAIRSRRNDAIIEAEAIAEAEKSKAEAREVNAKAAKLEAETDSIEVDTKIKKYMADSILRQQQENIKGSEKRLKDVLKQLKVEGGKIYIDKEQLKALFRKGLPQGDSDTPE